MRLEPMTDWKEINRISKDPGAVRILAKSLLRMPDAARSDWEVDFLEHMSRRQDPLTTLQAEKLIQIRDDAQFFSTYDGFSVATLIERCWAARFDLNSDEDITFIERLKGRASIRKRDVGRLFRCCREVFILEKSAR
jgi:hypothetical protein